MSVFGPVQQEWVLKIPMMQQSVLFAAVRGPDGLRKHHPVKILLRWYRRSVLLSAFDKRVLMSPSEPGGGSFTGPFTLEHARLIFGREHVDKTSIDDLFNSMRGIYLEYVDEIPHHFHLHFMHAAQIVGAHHSNPSHQFWWTEFYNMIVNAAHLLPEPVKEMNMRLSDNSEEWKAREWK